MDPDQLPRLMRETWNTPGGVVPDPIKGLWAAVLIRDTSGWSCAGSTQDQPVNG